MSFVRSSQVSSMEYVAKVTHRLADAEVRPLLVLGRVLVGVLQVLAFTSIDEVGEPSEDRDDNEDRDVLPELLSACEKRKGNNPCPDTPRVSEDHP